MKSAIVFTFLLIISATACTKDKPRRGLYWGEFYTMDSTGTDITRYDHNIQVDRPTENSVTINGYTLEKNGKNIKGQMGYTPAFTHASTVMLDGKWSSKNGNYTIEGEFAAIGQSISYFGSFRMGSY